MDTLQIETAELESNYTIKLYLSDGQQVLYDLHDKVKTARFCDLSNPQIFLSGKLVNQKIIRWTPSVELSLEEILMNMDQIQHENVTK